MKTKYILLLAFAFWQAGNLSAQHNLRFTPTVKPTQGGSSRVGNFQLDFTIGEPAQKTLRNGNLVFTEGFEQNEKPLPPIALPSQSVCSDSAYTFTFAPVYAGAGGDQVEWSLNSNFDTSYIIASGDTIQLTLDSGRIDTIWLRSVTRLTGCKSANVTTTANFFPLPLPKTTYVLDSVVVRDSSTFIYVLNSQIGVRYKLRNGIVYLDSKIGNGDTIKLNTGRIDSNTNLIVEAIDTITSCARNYFASFHIVKVDGISVAFDPDFLGHILISNGRTYTQTKEAAEAYFAQKVVPSNIEDEEDGEYANFARWKSYWEDRVDSADGFAAHVNQHKELLLHPTIPNDCDPTDEDPNWLCLGPFESTSGQHNQGRIQAIAVAPGQTDIFNTVYVGSAGGGIFKTTNGNATSPIWVNITDPSGYGGTGIRSITINPQNPDWILAATGTTDPGVWITGAGDYTFGLIQSLDGGDSWAAVPDLSSGPNLWSSFSKVVLLPTTESNHMDLVLIYSDKVVYAKLELSGATTTVTKTVLREPPGHIIDYSTPPITTDLPKDEYYEDFQVDPNHPTWGYLSGYLMQEAYNHWGSMRQHAFLFKVPISATPSAGDWDNTNFNNSNSDNLLSYISQTLTTNIIPSVCDIGSYTDFTPSSFAHTWTANDISTLKFSLTTHGNSTTRIVAYIKYEFNVRFTTNVRDEYCVKSFAVPSQISQPTNWSNIIGYLDEWTTIPTWNGLITPVLPGDGINYGFFCSPLNEDVLYAEGRCNSLLTSCRHIIRSTNGGANFAYMNETNVHGDVRSIEVVQSHSTDPSLDVVFEGNDGGIAVKKYNSNTMTAINGKGLNVGLYLGLGNIEKDVDRIHAGAQDGSIEKYDGAWDPTYSTGGDNGDCLLLTNPNSGSEILITEGNWVMNVNTGLPRTRNGTCSSGSCFTLMPLCMNPVDEFEEFVGFYDVERVEINTTTNTNTFTALSSLGKRVKSIAKGHSTAGDNDLLYYSTTFNNHILKAVDNGTATLTWNNTTDVSSQSITDIALDPNEAQHVFISCGAFDNGIKVYESTDAGDNWTNVSGCIPNFPVNSIVFQKGTASTYDRLFVGTDVGVYYGVRDGGTFLWRKMEGIPDVQVYDMELHNCGQKLQIATFGRGIWEANLPPLPPYTLDDDEEWDADQSRFETIIIPDGYTLHITDGAVISMARGTNIIVEPGGKLIVDDGATITNTCGTMWDGIIVKGDPEEPQTIVSGMSNQGYVVLNDATIENAVVGVRLYNPFGTGILETGGIIQAENTTFRNNHRSVEFGQYHHWLSLYPELTEAPNRSSFAKCIFTTNDNHSDEHPFDAFVTAYSVPPLYFYGCSFENHQTVTGNTRVEELGDGIRVLDAAVFVTDYGASDGPITRTSFLNLEQGVHVMQSILPYSSTVLHAQFHNCLRGIRDEGVNLCTFVGNDFTMGGNQADNIGGSHHFDESIILHQCTGFRVEQNTFTDTVPPLNLTIGIRSDQTGTADNQIYNNTFTDVFVGDLANRQNQNGNNTTPRGLNYNCNQNEDNNIYDFCAVGEAGHPLYGVNARQGSTGLSAGNIFSLTDPSGDESDFYNSGINLVYYFFDNSDEPRDFTDPPKVDPQSPPNIDENECPTNFVLPTGGTGNPPDGCITCLSISGYSTAYSGYNQAWNSYHQQYIGLIDGGNTQRRMAQADTMSNATALKDTMLAYAPNLSSGVLEIVASRSSLLNNTQQHDVLKANAEAVTPKVMADWIKWAAPPQWMRDSVLAASSNLTYRSYLLDSVLYNANQKQQTVYNILHRIQHDTTGFNITNYRLWLDSADGIWAKQQMINTYFLEGRLDTVEAIIANYDTIIEKTDSIAFKSYKDFALAYVDWIAADTLVNRLDSANLAELKNIAAVDEHRIGSNMARNVLNSFYDSLYFTPAKLPDGVSFKHSDESEANFSAENIKPAIIDALAAIKVYPNPAQNSVTIEYIGLTESSKLVVVNVIGGLIENRTLNESNGKITINTSGYANGVYLMRVESGEKLPLKSKFIIQK